MSFLLQGKQPNYFRSQLGHSRNGTLTASSIVSEQKEITSDMQCPTSGNSCLQTKNRPVEKSATVESQPLLKKKIWKDKLNSSNESTTDMTLLRILDRVSTGKGKDLKPFWTESKKEISQKLWLPTETDSVDLVLSSSKECSNDAVMGKSWFSIKRKHPLKKNSLMTSFQSSQFFLPDSTASEVTPSSEKSKTQLKTMKFRLLPTQQEREKLLKDMEIFRWYYNFSLTVLNLDCKRNDKKLEEYKSVSYYTLRDKIVSKYKYTEEQVDNLLFVDYVYDETNKKIAKPDWMDDSVNNRIPRGAIKKLSGNVNSCLSNKRNGNISRFNMNYLSRKKSNEFLLYEDANFPSWLRNIESRFWFTTKDRKRKTISFSDVFSDTPKKGMEIIFDKVKDQFYLHYPVEINYFPPLDRRSDNQRDFVQKEENRIISLDPGVRKFMVGYDPKGSLIYFGERANQKLKSLLLRIDKLQNNLKDKLKLWRKIR